MHPRGNLSWATPTAHGMGWAESQFPKKVFARNCIRCPQLFQKVIFGNPIPYWVRMVGLNFKIKFSLLEWNEMSRSAEESHVAQLLSLPGCRWIAGGQFTKHLLWEIEWNIQISPEKLCWPPPLEWKGCGWFPKKLWHIQINTEKSGMPTPI